MLLESAIIIHNYICDYGIKITCRENYQEFIIENRKQSNLQTIFFFTNYSNRTGRIIIYILKTYGVTGNQTRTPATIVRSSTTEL